MIVYCNSDLSKLYLSTGQKIRTYEMESLEEVTEETYTIDSSKEDEKILSIISFDFKEGESVVVLTNYGLYKFTNFEPSKPEVIKDTNEGFQRIAWISSIRMILLHEINNNY